MGEQSDMMINGDMCEMCGEDLGEGSGYPRNCTACTLDADEKRQKKIVQARRIMKIKTTLPTQPTKK